MDYPSRNGESRISDAINEASAVILGLESLRATGDPSARKNYIELAKSSANSLAAILQSIDFEETLRQRGEAKAKS